MIHVGLFIISKFVTVKAIHVLHLSECSHRYGSGGETKMLDGLIIKNVNKPTATGRSSWFVRVLFHLGGRQTKLHKTSVCSVKREYASVICEEEHEIPDAVPID